MGNFAEAMESASMVGTAVRETVLPNAAERSTCFFYHRTRRYNVTVAYRRQGNRVVYGAAFCRPGDQFSKRRGREIALGRMDTYEHYVSSPGSARWEVHEAILSGLTHQDFVPYVPENFRT